LRRALSPRKYSEISDVGHLFEITDQNGRNGPSRRGTSVFIDTSDLSSHKVPEDLARQLRASTIFLVR
jgi:UDP-N-acetylglucosamine enolpyruvyl transferase